MAEIALERNESLHPYAVTRDTSRRAKHIHSHAGIALIRLDYAQKSKVTPQLEKPREAKAWLFTPENSLFLLAHYLTNYEGHPF